MLRLSFPMSSLWGFVCLRGHYAGSSLHMGPSLDAAYATKGYGLSDLITYVLPVSVIVEPCQCLVEAV